MRTQLLLVACLVACAGSRASGPGSLRFTNADPVTVVNDRVPIAPPAHRDRGLIEYYFDEDLARPIDRVLTVGEAKRASNVNSLGEVPDSAWFTNRAPTPEQIRRGPGGGGPSRDQPWSVVGVKVGGAAIGIMIVDARGDKYVLKFDERGHAETETSADVIVQRLTWAVGYNVPDNNIVSFERADLVLAPDAVIRDRAGGKTPMKQADLERYLAMAESDNGKFRALAGKLIGGKILGGVEPEGVRRDDPNDRVPHERRRDLRGQRMLWAWVNHIDLKTQNSLATYTDDKYIAWYALDFGESLGVAARTTGLIRLGHRHAYAPASAALSLVTFGLYVQPWERGIRVPPYRGLGRFESASFDPETWQANHNWRPVDVADRFDELWSATKLLALSPAHVAAAVDAGQYTDARTRAYMIKTLIERQHAIGRYAFDRVAPLTGVSATEAAGQGNPLALCFDDLWLRHGYGATADTRYAVSTFSYAGDSLERTPWVTRAATARTCVSGLPLGQTRDGYTIARIDVERAGRKLPPVFVHVARGPQGLRVVGLDRR